VRVSGGDGSCLIILQNDVCPVISVIGGSGAGVRGGAFCADFIFDEGLGYSSAERIIGKGKFSGFVVCSDLYAREAVLSVIPVGGCLIHGRGVFIDAAYAVADDIVLIVNEKPPQNLQAAKQNGLMQLHQCDFPMNDVVCVSQIDFRILFGFNNLQTL
jgi:hypothetical protein